MIVSTPALTQENLAAREQESTAATSLAARSPSTARVSSSGIIGQSTEQRAGVSQKTYEAEKARAEKENAKIQATIAQLIVEDNALKESLATYKRDTGYDLMEAIEDGFDRTVLVKAFGEDAVKNGENLFNAVSPFKGEDGYRLTDAVKEVDKTILNQVFGDKAVSEAEQWNAAMVTLEPYKSDTGYDLIKAIKGNVGRDTLVQAFGESVIADTEELISTIAPYQSEDGGYNIANAIGSVDREVLVRAFGDSAVVEAENWNKSIESIVSYKTDKGYNLMQAVEDGFDRGTLATVFGEEAINDIEQTLSTLAPYKTDEGYNLANAVISVDEAVLIRMFGQEAVDDAKEWNDDVVTLEPYKTEEGYNLVDALNAKFNKETLVRIFGQEAVDGAETTISYLAILEPYKTADGYNVIDALRQGVSEDVIAALFDKESVSSSKSIVQILNQLEPYKTADGYNVIEAALSGFSITALTEVFGKDAADKAYATVSFIKDLEPYKSATGYNLAGALSSPLWSKYGKQPFIDLFGQIVINTKAATETMVAFRTVEGYDLVKAMRDPKWHSPNSQLEWAATVLFGQKYVWDLHNAVETYETFTANNVQLANGEWVSKQTWDSLSSVPDEQNYLYWFGVRQYNETFRPPWWYIPVVVPGSEYDAAMKAIGAAAGVAATGRDVKPPSATSAITALSVPTGIEAWITNPRTRSEVDAIVSNYKNLDGSTNYIEAIKAQAVSAAEVEHLGFTLEQMISAMVQGSLSATDLENVGFIVDEKTQRYVAVLQKIGDTAVIPAITSGKVDSQDLVALGMASSDVEAQQFMHTITVLSGEFDWNIVAALSSGKVTEVNLIDSGYDKALISSAAKLATYKGDVLEAITNKGITAQDLVNLGYLKVDTDGNPIKDSDGKPIPLSLIEAEQLIVGVQVSNRLKAEYKSGTGYDIFGALKDGAVTISELKSAGFPIEELNKVVDEIDIYLRTTKKWGTKGRVITSAMDALGIHYDPSITTYNTIKDLITDKWSQFTPEQKLLVANIYSTDVYKKDWFAEFSYTLSSAEGGLVKSESTDDIIRQEDYDSLSTKERELFNAKGVAGLSTKPAGWQVQEFLGLQSPASKFLVGVFGNVWRSITPWEEERHETPTSYIQEHGVQSTQQALIKNVGVQAYEFLVPGAYIANHRKELSTLEFGALLAVDVATTLLMLGPAWKTAKGALRSMTGGNKAIELAIRTASTVNKTQAELRAATKIFRKIPMAATEKYAVAANRVQQAIQASKTADVKFLESLSSVTEASIKDLKSIEHLSGFKGFTREVKVVSKLSNKLLKEWKNLDDIVDGAMMSGRKYEWITKQPRYMKQLTVVQRTQDAFGAALSNANKVLEPAYTMRGGGSKLKIPNTLERKRMLENFRQNLLKTQGQRDYTWRRIVKGEMKPTSVRQSLDVGMEEELKKIIGGVSEVRPEIKPSELSEATKKQLENFVKETGSKDWWALPDKPFSGSDYSPVVYPVLEPGATPGKGVSQLKMFEIDPKTGELGTTTRTVVSPEARPTAVLTRTKVNVVPDAVRQQWERAFSELWYNSYAGTTVKATDKGILSAILVTSPSMELFTKSVSRALANSVFQSFAVHGISLSMASARSINQACIELSDAVAVEIQTNFRKFNEIHPIKAGQTDIVTNFRKFNEIHPEMGSKVISEFRNLNKVNVVLSPALENANKTIEEALVRAKAKSDVGAKTKTQLKEMVEQKVKLQLKTMVGLATETPIKDIDIKPPAPKRPRIRLPDESKEEMEFTKKELKGSVAWKQGWDYTLVLQDGRQFHTKEPVKGVPYKTGHESPQKSFTAIGGGLKKARIIERGIVTINIPKGSRKGLDFDPQLVRKLKNGVGKKAKIAKPIAESAEIKEPVVKIGAMKPLPMPFVGGTYKSAKPFKMPEMPKQSKVKYQSTRKPKARKHNTSGIPAVWSF